jgi:hypothetical protein
VFVQQGKDTVIVQQITCYIDQMSVGQMVFGRKSPNPLTFHHFIEKLDALTVVPLPLAVFAAFE